MKKLICLTLSLAMLHAAPSIAATEKSKAAVAIYSYHIDPPFYFEDKTNDLSHQWVDRINRFQNSVQFTLINIERPALNSLIESGKPYLVLWANPIWFRSRDPQVEASTTIFWDSDIWISLLSKKVNYDGPQDLIGKTMGGRQGYFYKGLSPLVQKGDLIRIDQSNDLANYHSLRKQQIDVFVMSRSSYLYWNSVNIDKQNLFVAASAHDAFTRHVLAGHGRESLLPIINQFLAYLSQDAQWGQQLQDWGLADLVNPFDIELDELEGVPVQLK